MSNRKQLSQAMICDAGEMLFSRHGYSAVGIKMILDEVGIPKGSFYHYFKSKEAFAVEVAEQYFTQRFDRFCNDLAKGGTCISEVILSTYESEIDDMFEHEKVRGCVLGNLFIEANSDLELLQTKLNDIYKRWLTVFTECIEKGQQQGEFRKDIDAKQLAAMFWAHWEGTVLKFQVYSDKEQVKQEMRNFIQLMANPSS